MEGVLLAGDAADGGWADVHGALNLFDLGFVGSPLEEVGEGKFDPVFVVDLVDELSDGRWRGHGGVVVDELSVDGEVFAIEEEEPVLVVCRDLDAEAVRADG